jgi:hypothetical protein
MTEIFKSIVLADVALTLRDLEPGPHLARDLYWKYIETVRAQGRAGGYASPFGKAMAHLGCVRKYSPEHGTKAWFIDPAGMAERWPSLPWSKVTVKCQVDAEAQMSAETVGWDA